MTERLITFGWHLDGQRGMRPSNSLGESVVGPLGLLTILETQLGLTALHPSKAERIVQFRRCLETLDTEQRFYHRSFLLDPLGTAACLLEWRDRWALFGWDGKLPGDSPKRLRDMADVEILAATAVSPGIGQRLNAVKAALKRRKPDIGKLRLIDPVASLPARWQAVLSEFSVEDVGEPKGSGGGFLGALQERLDTAASGKAATKLAWQDDGTVVVAQAETGALAAHWLAGLLGETQPTLLLCGADGAWLDAHLAATNRSRQGLKEMNAFRPALQLLPLAMELMWKPLNYYALVQFLTHPICPVPNFARLRLAEKVAEAPGIGGERWQNTLDKIDAHYPEERRGAVREQIAFWIEHDRFLAAEGAKTEAVIERVRRLAEFFRLRLGETDQATRLAFHAGYEQCRASLNSLKELLAQGVSRIYPRQLQKLVAQATASGSENQLWPAEVGAHQMVTHPGAVAEPTSRVIWWQLTMPALPGAEPWGAREILSLRDAGVALPAVSALLDQAAKEWLRPVMAAQEQLILVLPPKSKEIHPLWQMICAIVDQPKVLQLDDMLSAGSERMCPLTPVPLQAPKRWWQLPANVSVPLRSKESFSSLELFLFNPYQWLLRYPAALHSSRLISIGGDFRMLGNLAHGLTRRYFLREDALTMPNSAFDAWFSTAFEEIIDQEGATLRIPGRGADLENLGFHLRRAMQTMREQVSKAAVVKVAPEHTVSGHFEGGALTGSADLVMLNGAGHSAIVDMKWGGIKKYPEQLKENRHLQLAVYAELLRQEQGSWPSVAFYILDRACLCAPDECFFPGTEVVHSKSGESTADLWDRFLHTWRWRHQQAQAGRFEVVLESIQPTEESAPPQCAIPIEPLNPAYNEFSALVGWER